MKIYLDCESRGSTIDSLCYLFNCTGAELTSLLGELDIETSYKDIYNSPNYTPDKYVYHEAVEAFGVPKKPTYLTWFHITRTCHDNKFHQGILPLGNALEFIWKSLLQTFKGTEHYSRLKDLKGGGIINYLFQQKTQNPFLWGPFAMLIKDAAF